MSESRTKTAGRVLGAVGLTALALLPFAYFGIGMGWHWIFSVQLGAGILGVAAYLVTNVREARAALTGRGTLFVTSTVLSSLFLLGGVAALNYLALRSKIEADLTRAGIFTLSPDSVKTAQALPGEVEILAFYPPGSPEYTFLENLVGLYQRYTDKLRLRSVDGAKEPLLAEKYKVREQSSRVVVVLGDAYEKVDELSEAALTNALLRLARGESRTLYFVVGHGESSLGDAKSERGLATLKEALETEGYQPKELALLRLPALPEDAAVVILAGPQAPYLPPEIQILQDYLDKGGRLIVLLDAGVDAGLGPLLERYGIAADDTLVIDAQGQLARVYGPAVPAVLRYAKHPITEGFDLATIYPTVRSLTPLNVQGIDRPLPLALTGETSWAETQWMQQPVGYDDGEKRGPLPVVLLQRAPRPSGTYSKEMRLVVFGDADFIGQRWIGELGNRDFFLNTVAYVSERFDRITIRPKGRAASRLVFLSDAQAMLLRVATLDLLPLVLAALGVAVWTVRRSQ